jgi:class 3 adenylate cyclase
LPTETRQVSILRLDIANFTKLIDSHPLDQIIIDLNAYLDQMAQIIYRHHGDIDKYLGDGFFSIFTNADDAVRAGHAIQQATAKFNRQQLAENRLVFPTRVAIDTGEVMMTSLGSSDRQDRTVIGMPVNLADRLQAKATPGRVWFSQATFDQLNDRSDCHCLGPIKVKGRQEPITVYEKRQRI